MLFIKKEEKMQVNPVNKSQLSFKQIKNKFDLISSENGTNWLLALNWILIIEFISSIIEYNFLDIAKNYVEPLQNGLYQAAPMIRVLHHMADAPKALAQIQATLQPGATFILEFANKLM